MGSKPVRVLDRISWRCIKQRLAMLLLFAFVCQVTLPYQTMDCPLYQTGHAIKKVAAASAIAMQPPCPLLAHQGLLPAKVPSRHGQDKVHTVTCSLCAVTSTLTADVAAGLISLPPPEMISSVRFISAHIVSASLDGHKAFSARAPPLSI